ncbi:MAG: TOBE domain-containing protein, partial [Thiobacillus sp.]|nr:TOBE domain-containing protein [Thiobacillus sp.]
MPFVTPGSLVNVCDCLMAGGTDRRNHSEVGSSYVHFNYTPHQDKATASLLGDVPHGVMLVAHGLVGQQQAYSAAARLFGRGISFPPRIGSDGRIAWSEGEQNVRESIRVILMTDDSGLKTSARNHLRGNVSRLVKGAVNTEVTMETSGGLTVNAIITNESVESLALDIGKPVSAIVKASHVILATKA